jgi:hypothetical protein
MKAQAPLPLLALAALLPAVIPAQDVVRWNDAARRLPDGPPTVHVWIDGPRIAPRGSAIRVRFEVSDEAHVMVARVDWQGRLTLLWPSSRGGSTYVSGGQEIAIRSSRLGGSGTFVASEMVGASGYVFAMASYAPFDLRQLSRRDFDRYVTGVPLDQPSARYIGDPHRVISRFARMVLPDDGEFEYDIDYYSVDRPTYASAAGFASYCRSTYWSNPGYYRLGYAGGLYDDFDDLGCGWANRSYYGCYSFGMSYLYGYTPIGCGWGWPRQVVTRGGQLPPTPTPPPLDSLKVNPWVPDSIKAPNPSFGQPTTGIERMPPPVPVGGDADDLSFSIPARALRGMRERAREGNRADPGTSGPMPMPGRPNIANSGGSGDIDWIRPPRAVDRAGDDPLPARGGRQRDFVSTRDREPTYAPPRGESPRRGRNADDWDWSTMPTREREIRTEGSRGGGGSPAREYSPPPRSDPPPRSEPTRSPASSGDPRPRVEERRPPAEQRRPPAEERRPPVEERRPPSEERRPY